MSQSVLDTLIIMGSIMGSSALILLSACFIAEHFFKFEDIDDVLKKWDEEGW